MFYMGNMFIFLALHLMARPVNGILMSGLRSVHPVGLVYAMLLFSIGVRMVAEGFRADHHGSLAGRYLAVFLMFLSLTVCANLDERTLVSDLLNLASFLVPGILISLYNNKRQLHRTPELPPAPMAIPEPKPLTIDSLSVEDRIMLRLNMAQHTQEACTDPEFMQNLKQSEAFLTGIRQSEYKMSSSVLEQIDGLLKIYLDLCTQIVQTERTKELKRKVIGSFSMITDSFEAMYDKSFEEKAIGIESDLRVLELKLKAEGLLGSDFEQMEQK